MKVYTDNAGQKHIKDFYAYNANLDSLAPGATATDVINIEADSDFIAVKTTYHCDIAGAAQTEDSRPVPLIDILITDSGSGRNLLDQFTPIDNIAGRGQLPFVLPVPRRFSANSSINISFKSNDVAATYSNVKLTFIGYKIFRL